MTDDLVTGIVQAYQESDGATTLHGLLDDTTLNKMVADFDPENVSRPYVIVTQGNFDNVYYAQGLTTRVDKIIINFRVFADTRQTCNAILTALDTFYSGVNLGLAVGLPTVADKVTQLDLDKIDAYRGQLNLVYYTQATPV